MHKKVLLGVSHLLEHSKLLIWMPRWILPLACLIFATLPLRAEEQLHTPWSAVCHQTTKFHDGDTLTCVSDPARQGTFVVRFAGIDAPETGQAYWRASRDHLRSLAGPGTVATCYKQDRYGREVCRLASSDGADLAEAMLVAGMAWHAVRYSNEETPAELARYSEAEQLARTARKGLWVEPSPQPPWDCRRRRMQSLRCH